MGDEQRRLQEEEYQRHGVPEGFAHHSGSWYRHPQQNIFWHFDTQKLYLYNELAKGYTEVHPGESIDGELHLSADASSIHRDCRARHVIVRDLSKAAQALRRPIDHLPRPCALFAIYDGHMRGDATEDAPCAEFCARNLYRKLLARLSEVTGEWGAAEIAEALQKSCEDVDVDFLARPGSATDTDGCSAAIALLTGRQLFLARLGDSVGLIDEKLGDGSRISRVRSASDGTQGEALEQARGSGEAVAQAFGDKASKSSVDGSAGPTLVPACPDISAITLERSHRFLALTCGKVARAMSDEEMARVLRRCSGRPRLACGELVQAAEARGATGSLAALCVYFDWTEEKEGAPPSKKYRSSSSAQQVRCRQILVKHRESREPIDRVRNRPVTRSLADAERILREAIGAIEGSPQNIFTQRCKAVSECSACLKGGEMAGDLGWLSRGQLHPALELAAFSLPVGRMSDIVESDEGAHLLWRIA